MIEFTLPVSEYRSVTIKVPENFDADDWALVDGQVRAFIALRDKRRGASDPRTSNEPG